MRHNEDRRSPTSHSEAGRARSADDVASAISDSLIVVSNRQPYRHEYEKRDGEENGDEQRGTKDGSTASSGVAVGGSSMISHSTDAREITVDRPTGGLTAGLDPVLQRTGGTWIAWGDGEADREVTDRDGCVGVPPETDTYTLKRVWLSDEAVDAYYRGFSNRVLWPLCHEFPGLVESRPGDLRYYRAVNRTFADAVVERADEDAVVWLQDYHFAFAPAMIEEDVPDSVTIGQFWHIPWPSPGVFQHCPARGHLLSGLLGNDLLGFHVDRYCERFLECVDRFVPDATVEWSRRSVTHHGSETRVVAIPMGVDAEAYDRECRAIDSGRWESFRDRHGIPDGCTIGLGVDRLDYTKGIPERLAAVERLFERSPEWRGEFTFVQKSTPSRTEVSAYERHGEYVRNEVERINARFGADGWQPIVYTEEYLPREDLCALYRRADVMIVSPLVDGMNLVAQEFVASCVDGDGALVLSETVGSHELLGESAYTIDPRRRETFTDTIETALTDSQYERARRITDLRRQVFDADLEAWMTAQFDELAQVHGSSATEEEPAGRSETV